MIACAHCHSPIHDASRFCPVCGAAQAGSAQAGAAPTLNSGMRQGTVLPPLVEGVKAFHGGFGQVFGLDPRVAFLTVAVDTMLFGGTFVTLGTSTLLALPAGIALGFITYKVQKHWYGDDRESALIKGLIVALLTAIPTSLPGLLTIPSGVIGLVHMLRRKKTEAPLIHRPIGG